MHFKYARDWQSVLIFLRFTHFFSVLKQFSWYNSAVVFCGYLQQSTRVLTTLQKSEQHRPESLDLPLRVGYIQHTERVINSLSLYPTPKGMESRFPSNQLWRGSLQGPYSCRFCVHPQDKGTPEKYCQFVWILGLSFKSRD